MCYTIVINIEKCPKTHYITIFYNLYHNILTVDVCIACIIAYGRSLNVDLGRLYDTILTTKIIVLPIFSHR